MTDATLTIIAMGIVVLAIRSVAFVFAGRLNLPPLVREALELAPPAILAAFLAAGFLIDRTRGALDLSLSNAYLLGGLATLVIAFRLKNFLTVSLLGYAVFLACHLWL